MIDDLSSGISAYSAIKPYKVKASSQTLLISVSLIYPRPAAFDPLNATLFKLSNAPYAPNRTTPPLGALGLT